MSLGLAGALELARLGGVPIGGKKWRGAGWIPWCFGRIQLWRAGVDESVGRRDGGEDLRARLGEVFGKRQPAGEEANG